MYGVSIDDEPDSPVGTPATRRTIAIHWEWTTQYSREEMATALGVKKSTIDRYIREGPTDEVQRLMDGVEQEVRMVAVAELKDQLKRAGDRSRTAEKPVKVWTDEDGNLQVNDEIDDETGKLTGKYPVPDDMEMGPDYTARFFRREEVREILQQLIDLVGAAEPDELEIDVPGVMWENLTQYYEE
jgi:predicted transcriptional regulator